MSKSSINAVFFVCLLFINSCNHKERLNVKDAKYYEEIKIVSKLKNPTGVKVSVRGNIDGAATIQISPWNVIELAGDFDKSFYQDWFESSCVVIYNPVNVKSGNVSIECVIYE